MLSMAPSRIQEFIAAVRSTFDKFAMQGELPVLLTSPAIRPYVRSIVERFRAIHGRPIAKRNLVEGADQDAGADMKQMLDVRGQRLEARFFLTSGIRHPAPVLNRMA